MGDFGTALIFFTTFLIISFLRSGDFSKLILTLGATGLMGLMVLRFRPYVAARFSTWGHAWEYPKDGGFQMVHTMSASASGGFVGLGAGQGHLKWVDAAEADLVFGLLSEEWGLIIAVLAVLCIITLGVFAVRSIIAGRSTYYSIAACAATSMLIMQTILNVMGSVDLLPLTGVTFPFVSAGGTSMIATWGLLAYLKAADTRQNASFAIRLDKKGEFEEYEDELSGDGYRDPREFFTQFGSSVAKIQKNRSDRTGKKKSPQAPPVRAKRKPDPEAMKDYTSDNLKDTRTHIGSSSENKGPLKYTNVSDDDFFGSFGDGPGDSAKPERPEKPSYRGGGLSRADDEFLTKMMDGPVSEDRESRTPARRKAAPSGKASGGSRGAARTGASASASHSAAPAAGGGAAAGVTLTGQRRKDSAADTAVRGSGRNSSAADRQTVVRSSDGSSISVSRGPSGWQKEPGQRRTAANSGRAAGRSSAQSEPARRSSPAPQRERQKPAPRRQSPLGQDPAAADPLAGAALPGSRSASPQRQAQQRPAGRSAGSQSGPRQTAVKSRQSDDRTAVYGSRPSPRRDFDEGYRQLERRSRSAGYDNDEEPLTLDDLFGGDDK